MSVNHHDIRHIFTDCVLHVTTNTVTHFQSALVTIIPSELLHSKLYRPDDILVCNKIRTVLFKTMEDQFCTSAASVSTTSILIQQKGCIFPIQFHDVADIVHLTPSDFIFINLNQ